ncbi:MAG: hypothetical protein ACFFDQ_09510 [Candidatus Thorarchaeota archaeon]
MGLAIRIDIDNPFGLSTRFRRRINIYSINYGFVPRWTRLGYLDNSTKLCKWLTNKGVPATWFFRTVSCPTKSLIPLFTNNGHQINLHAERTGSLGDFTQEVRKWEKLCSTKVTGFTKHGSGYLRLSKKHDVKYDPESLLHFAQELGMDYFIGNDMDYTKSIIKDDGFVYVPSIFWLDRLNQYDSGALDKLVEVSADIPVVLLIHPVWWVQEPDVRKNLEWLVEKVEFEPLDKLLQIVP